MALSARNQLAGKIKDIQIGDIMAHVVVKVGDNLIESVITRTSAEELRLSPPVRRCHQLTLVSAVLSFISLTLSPLPRP